MEELAKKAGISKSFLWAVENDKSDIGGENIINIANALGASVDFILRGGKEEQHKTTPIEIPRQLSEIAEELGLSFRETHALLQAHRSIIARRGGRTDLETMTPEQWKKLWAGIKEFIRPQ